MVSEKRFRRTMTVGVCIAGMTTGLLWFSALAVPARSFGAVGGMPPTDRFELANALYDRGILDLAIGEYLHLVEHHPEFERRDAVLYRLGLSYSRLERKPDAARVLQRLLDEYPESVYRHRASLRRALLDLEAGDPAAAERRLQSLLGAEPPPDMEAAARHELALLLAAQDRHQEAEDQWSALIERLGDSPYAGHAALQWGSLMLQRGERPDEARALLERAARHEPVTPDAQYLLGMHAFDRADYETAAGKLQQVVDKHPAHQRAAEAVLPLAWSLYHQGNYLDVLALAGPVAEEDPARDVWLYLRANAQRGLYRRAEALAAYDELLAQFPDSPYREAAAYERAVVSFQSGDHAATLEVLEGMTFADSLREDVYWLQAEAHAAQQQRDAALQAYRRLFERYPESPRAPQAAYRMAHVLRDGGDSAPAYAMLRRLVEKYPEAELAPQAQLEAAVLMAEQGDHEQAVRDWSLLIENYPQAEQREPALYRRALAQARMQRQDAALASLRTLLQDYPQTVYAPQAQGWIGLLLASRREWNAAEQALRKALELPLDETWQREVQWRLVQVLQQRGEESEAARWMQALLSTDKVASMDPGQLAWLARYHVGQEAWEETVNAAEALVARDADPAWQEIGWYLVGRGLEAQQRTSDARRAYRRSGSRQAGTREGASAWLREGRLALASGEAEVARRAFEDALQRVGTDDGQLDLRAQAYIGLGRAAERLQQPEAALRYYLAVGVLFDHPQWTPTSLARAAAVMKTLGQDRERQELLREMRERYPDFKADEDAAATLPGTTGSSEDAMADDAS